MPKPTDKATIRRDVGRRLRALGSAGRRRASDRIAAKLAELMPPQALVLAFWPMTRSEPDIRPALETALRAGTAIALPRTEGDRLVPHRVGGFDRLAESPLGVLEPSPDAGAKPDLAEIDLVLVPGVAFTRAGVRLGRGGGHYDRFLARLRGDVRTIGIAFQAQLFEELPAEAHDIAVDLVLTDG